MKEGLMKKQSSMIVGLILIVVVAVGSWFIVRTMATDDSTTMEVARTGNPTSWQVFHSEGMGVTLDIPSDAQVVEQGNTDLIIRFANDTFPSVNETYELYRDGNRGLPLSEFAKKFASSTATMSDVVVDGQPAKRAVSFADSTVYLGTFFPDQYEGYYYFFIEVTPPSLDGVLQGQWDAASQQRIIERYDHMVGSLRLP